jgi:thiosulfate/3-mercaptopyruvate sulfurtransferase
MIEYAEGRVPNALAIEGRGAGATTTGVYTPPAGTDYVVFEGRINGAQPVLFTTLYDAGYKYLPTDQLIAAFAAVGLDSSKSAYVYCRIGVQGSVVFFVLDGILGWPATFYDGSWSQWGQLSGDAANKGQLAADSPWRTDMASRSSNMVPNWPTRAVEQFTADGSVCSATYAAGTGTILNSTGGATACTNLPDSYDTNANRIEEGDKAYMNSGSGGGGGGGGGGGAC